MAIWGVRDGRGGNGGASSLSSDVSIEPANVKNLQVSVLVSDPLLVVSQFLLALAPPGGWKVPVRRLLVASKRLAAFKEPGLWESAVLWEYCLVLGVPKELMLVKDPVSFDAARRGLRSSVALEESGLWEGAVLL